MFLARLVLILLISASNVAAQDLPDMTRLPTLTRPGTLTTTQMQHQAAWLQVDQTRLYR